MNAETLLVILTLLLYAAATALVWRGHRSGLPGDRKGLLVGALAVVAHGVLTAQALNGGDGLNLGMVPVIELLLFVATLFIVTASFFTPVSNLLLFAFPMSAAIIALGAVDPRSAETSLALSTPLLAHIIFAIVAYGILIMAAGQSLLLGYQERRLRARTVSGLMGVLPPLETMEHLLFAMLWLGISILTLAIATGFVYLEDLFAQRVVHHTILACLSWLVYAVLLAGRHLFGWRGSTAVRFTLSGFGLLVLAYLGSKFVIEVLLAGAGQ